jgi:hypothetical protein
VLDLLPHAREEYRERMGHVRLGLEPAVLAEWAREAGWPAPRVVPLPVDPAVEGPALFAATLFAPSDASDGVPPAAPRAAPTV